MTKATRILNEYHIKELILKGNPQYENFYKEELIEFCKISKHEIDRLNNVINGQQKRIDKTIEAIDEMLVYNNLTDTTSAFGNAPRELKFYLSDCETLDKFDKLKGDE